MREISRAGGDRRLVRPPDLGGPVHVHTHRRHVSGILLQFLIIYMSFIIS